MDGTSKMDTHTSNRTKAKVQEKPLGKKNWTLSVRHVCEVMKLFLRSKSCTAVESSQFSWHSPENTNHVFGTVRPHINTKGKTIFHIHNERDMRLSLQEDKDPDPKSLEWSTNREREVLLPMVQHRKASALKWQCGRESWAASDSVHMFSDRWEEFVLNFAQKVQLNKDQLSVDLLCDCCS